ncbi:MAG: BtrH N-terminal domain-containing protein [Brevundimonas sp.]|nr:BtrH N-terminal domain-containing protein [Brevundimonas sp.]
MTGPAISASSLWVNIETLLAERLPPVWAQAMLGAWCGYGRYARDVPEYAWPSRAATVALKARSGIGIHARGDDDDQSALRRHLDQGLPAIVAVDSYHLPYRPAFQRVHAGRTLVVRRGSAGGVWIEDLWPPAWRGEAPWEVLALARASKVPRVAELEPVFSGVPITRRWWSFDVGGPPDDPSAWLKARLADLWADGHSGAGAPTAISQARLLMAALEGDAPLPTATRRRASLVLRTETSVRAYRIALLRLAAQRLGDGLLAREADRQVEALTALALVRDLLIKSIVMPRAIYDRVAADGLRVATAAEGRLSAVLQAYAAVTPRVLEDA